VGEPGVEMGVGTADESSASDPRGLARLDEDLRNGLFRNIERLRTESLLSVLPRALLFSSFRVVKKQYSRIRIGKKRINNEDIR
jgi:hypothetical protein